MAQVAPELMTFTVQVPDNAPPGALVQFTAPNGQSVQAQIPPGLGPGAQFTIAVPAAVQQQHGPDTAVGVVEEGGLQGVLRGLDGVVYFPRKDMLAGQCTQRAAVVVQDPRPMRVGIWVSCCIRGLPRQRSS